MRRVRAILKRVVGTFARDRRDAELAAELDCHVQMHIEEKVRAGMSAEEARRDALLKLGGFEQTKEMYRDRRGLPWLETLWQDVRFGARMMRKNPGFTAVAILTLALGIGANAAVFSIVNAVMLRPLPYEDSERLISVHSKSPMFPDLMMYLNWPAFEKVRKQVSSFEHSFVTRGESKALTGRGDPQLLEVASVSNGFFEELGSKLIVGRLLGDADAQEKNGKVIVLGEALWRTQFGGDKNIVGQTVALDGNPYVVIGVTARGFMYPDRTEAWTSLVVEDEIKTNPLWSGFEFLGRLKRGVEMKQLDAELKVVAEQMRKEYPQVKDGYELVPTKMLDNEVADARVAFFVLLGAATLVLLIACTNLASMLLSRGWGRQQEMAVRAALGASRGRIYRQVLVENCLLAVGGGGAGVGLATLGVRIFRMVAPEDTPRIAEIHPDWTLVAFALGSALVTGILFGLVPARHAVRPAIGKILKEGAGRSVGGGRLSKTGAAVVAAEIALAFVLLIGAGLMVQTLWRLLHQDTGFATENLLAFDVYQSEVTSEAEHQRRVASQIAQTKSILGSVGQIPGVEKVAAVNYALLDGRRFIHGGLRVEGSTTVDKDAKFAVVARYVSPSYFQTLGQKLRRGREFSEADEPNTNSVVIVNEKMAQTYWGTLDVLGKRISISRDVKGKELWSEIVGVVSDARDVDVRTQPGPEYYVPLFQGGALGSCLLVRTAGNPDALRSAITKRIWREYPDLPVTHITTVRDTIQKSVGNERLHTGLLGVFAATGLLMALGGTYGVIAYMVERRTQEIGIRMALGAEARDVLLLVGRHAFRPVLAGIAAGVPVALAAQKALGSELFGVKATDPVTFVGAALLMLVVAALACAVPALRATRVDPMVALREE